MASIPSWNASTDKWLAAADELGVEIDEGVTHRDAIRSAVLAAGEPEPDPEPDEDDEDDEIVNGDD